MSKLDDLSSSIYSKTDEELSDLYKEYSVDNKDDLFSAVQKLMQEKKVIVESDVKKISNSALTNVRNHITSLENVAKENHNIHLAEQYEVLISNFKSLEGKLVILDTYLKDVLPLFDALEDANDELKRIKDLIEELTRAFSLSVSFDGCKKFREEIKANQLLAEHYQDKIAELRAAIISKIDENYIDIDIENFKIQLFENLENINANYEGIDESIGINAESMKKYLESFQSFFYEPYLKYVEFMDFLNENDMSYENNNKISNELVTDVARFVNDFHKGWEKAKEDIENEIKQQSSETTETKENNDLSKEDTVSDAQALVTADPDDTAKVISPSDSVQEEPDDSSKELPPEEIAEDVNQNSSSENIFKVVSKDSTSNDDLVAARIKAKDSLWSRTKNPGGTV